MPACHAGGRGFEPLLGRHVGASFISLAPIFYAKIRVRSCRCSSLFAKGHAHAGYSLASALITPLTRYQPFARCASGTSIFRSSAFSHKSKLYIACSDFLCKNQSSLMPLLLLIRKDTFCKKLKLRCFCSGVLIRCGYFNISSSFFMLLLYFWFNSVYPFIYPGYLPCFSTT